MSDEPRERAARDMPTLYEITDRGQTLAVIYDVMADQPGTRANGERFGLRFRVLAVRAG